jgi:hypothetical protein
VEIADGMTVHMTRRGIAAVLPPEDESEEAADDDEAVDEDADLDEAAVMEGEEAVTGASEADASPAERR